MHTESSSTMKEDISYKPRGCQRGMAFRKDLFEVERRRLRRAKGTIALRVARLLLGSEVETASGMCLPGERAGCKKISPRESFSKIPPSYLTNPSSIGWPAKAAI